MAADATKRIMYRKQADRLIVRDVKTRLAQMEDPDWRRAVTASWMGHPDWYAHHQEGDSYGRVGRLLKAAGVELVLGKTRMSFVGNEGQVATD